MFIFVTFANAEVHCREPEPLQWIPVSPAALVYQKISAAFHVNPRVRYQRNCVRLDFLLPPRAPAQAEPAEHRRGFIGNNTHQVGTFAEDYTLRIRNARIAQLNSLGVKTLPCLQNLARTGCIAIV